MVIMKDALRNSPALTPLDVSAGGRQIVVGVDAGFEGWGAILQQQDQNQDQNPC
jgi:hypothetical protein